MEKNLYEILEIQSNASNEDIKKAYKRLALVKKKKKNLKKKQFIL